MIDKKDNWFICLLKRIGIIVEYDITKKTMCEKAKLIGMCQDSCCDCVWYERNDNGD